jgi:hypothetical protein
MSIPRKNQHDSAVRTDGPRQDTGLSRSPETALKKVDPPKIESTPLKIWKDANGVNRFATNSDESGDDIIKGIMGTKDSEIAKSIMSATYMAVHPTLTKEGGDNVDKCMNIILQSMHDFQPKDAIEARLISQAIALYQHGMSRLAKAGISENVQHSESYVNMATKLFRVHNETIEAIDRHRRGGEQRVIVQHQQVNITGQAQAVVGNFHSEGGGGAVKNRGETPCQQCAEPKPEPTKTNPVLSRPWLTDDVDSTVEKVLAPRQRKVGRSSKT